MIVRCAYFEGEVAEKTREEFRSNVVDRVLPAMAKFPGVRDVRAQWSREIEEGVDGIFVGPADLAASFGHIGNPQHPRVQKAIQDAAQRLAAVGKPSGILTFNDREAQKYIEWGYSFIAAGSELGLLARGADALAQRCKGG